MGTLLDPIFSLHKTLSLRGRLLIRSRVVRFCSHYWVSGFGDTRRGRLFECRRSRRRKATKSEMSAALTTFALDDPPRVLYGTMAGATGKPAVITALEATFGHLGEKLAAVAGERVRGDDGEPDTKRC